MSINALKAWSFKSRERPRVRPHQVDVIVAFVNYPGKQRLRGLVETFFAAGSRDAPLQRSRPTLLINVDSYRDAGSDADESLQGRTEASSL